MTRIVTIVLMLLAVTLTAVAEGDLEEEAIEALTTIESPTGRSIEGHWDCWFEHVDLEHAARENDGIVPTRCAVALHYSATVLELSPEGKGWMLAVYTEDSTNQDFDRDAAFRIEGSDRFYSRAGELRWLIQHTRWEFDSGYVFPAAIRIQTKINEWFGLEIVSENVIRFGRQPSGPSARVILRLLLRTGSEEAQKMIDYRECVLENEHKNLFDVKPCELPIRADQLGRVFNSNKPPPRLSG